MLSMVLCCWSRRIRSTIRSELFGLDDPTLQDTSRGERSYQLAVAAGFERDRVKGLVGAVKHLVTYPVQCGSVLNCVAVVENKAWAFESWHEPGELVSF